MDRMTTTTTKTCECGCGAEVARRFRPGHDAKLKARLVSDLRSADWRRAHDAADMLLFVGWGHFAPVEALRSVPRRDHRGAVKHHVAEVEAFQVDPQGVHHTRRTCTALTAKARKAGMTNRTTKLAVDAFVDVVPNTPELATRLQSSWDSCPCCCADTHRDEDAARLLVLRRLSCEA